MPSPRLLGAVAPALAIAVVACSRKPPQPGDPCRGGAGADVCIDPGHRLSCRAFGWHIDACRGSQGCYGGACDQSLSDEGDSCGDVGALACSVDGRQLLRCDGTHMVASRACRGDRGCHRDVASTTPACDTGPAEAGDACDLPDLDRCGADGKSLLECSRATRRMQLGRKCLGPKGCFVDRYFTEKDGHTLLACDVAIADPGDPCEGVGVVCSRDGEHELVCNRNTLRFETGPACSCSVEWDKEDRTWAAGCQTGSSMPWRSAVYLYLGGA